MMMPVRVALDRIEDNPFQVRGSHGNVQGLARDIEKNGVLQEPYGRIVDDNGHPVSQEHHLAPDAALSANPSWRVQLCFGHRRVRAYRLLADQGVRDRFMFVRVALIDDEEMAVLSYAENASREDLSPIEEAQALQQMIDVFGWTHANVADVVGIARPTVSNKLRLLSLPATIKQRVQRGDITERQAFALLPLYDLSKNQINALNELDEKEGCVPPRLIEQKALGGAPSDTLREMVNTSRSYAEWLETSSRLPKPQPQNRSSASDSSSRHKEPKPPRIEMRRALEQLRDAAREVVDAPEVTAAVSVSRLAALRNAIEQADTLLRDNEPVPA